VSSTAAIEEPFLNFLISARWPNGRMLREYTALLDVPTFANPEQAPAAPAVQTPQATAPAPVPAVAAPPAPSASPAGDYTVRDGDSLWQIASSVRPSNAV